MRDHPEVLSAAAEVQSRLAPFSGLHHPPRTWLHMTMFAAGPTTAIDSRRRQVILAGARERLGSIRPAHVSVSRILYHPEAVMLAVKPRGPLLAIRDALELATRPHTGDTPVDDEQERWIPHVTASYGTAVQDARPIIDAAGRFVRPRETIVDAVTLVVQWGPEQEWNWEIVGTASVGSALDGTSPRK